MIKHIMHYILLCSLFFSCGPLPSAPPPPYATAAHPIASGAIPGILTITVFDVGQGDAALVSTPAGRNILIDGGPPGTGKDVILPYLASKNISGLDITIASHYDLDHIGGLPEVFDGTDGIPGTDDDSIPVTCWDRGEAVEDATTSLKRYFELRTPCHKALTAGEKIILDEGVTISVLAINGEFADGLATLLNEEDENAHSAALLLTYGAFTYLTAGDLPGGGGDPPYTTIDLETPLSRLVPEIDVLHVSHHGSETATNAALLATANPKAVVISVGNSNPYGHPHRAVLRRLAGIGIPIYLTEHGDNELPATTTVMNGPIVIETDGEGFTIRK